MLFILEQIFIINTNRYNKYLNFKIEEEERRIKFESIKDKIEKQLIINFLLEEAI